MSADSSQSRAAELAAEQVESIVEAAQHAADEIRAKATREAGERTRDAEREAQRIRANATGEAERRLGEAQEQAISRIDDAQQEADKLLADSRRRASERIEGAQRAAAEALAQSEAVIEGMRQLGQTLEGQAQRMLRDVQAGHRQLLADLRAPTADTGSSPAPRAGRRSRPLSREDEERLEAIRAAERSSRPAPRRRAEGGERSGPVEDLDVPRWVGPEP
jgi:hypothetical protein